MTKSKFGKYFLFFVIPSLTVMVSAKQPTTHWEVVILIGSMLLQGFIGVKALQSDPNATDQDKSNNMPKNNGIPKEIVINQPPDKPIPVAETNTKIESKT